MLLPISASFATFGIGKIQARIVSLLYLLLTALFLITKRELGSGVYGIILILLFYSMRQLELSLWVLGEIPSLAFLVLGSALWLYGSQRYMNMAFIIMGLAVVTKFYFLFSLLPILLTHIWYSKQIFGLRDLSLRLLKSTFFFLLPLFVLEITKLFTLGIYKYKNYSSEFAKFAKSQNLPLGIVLSGSHNGKFALTKMITFLDSVFPTLPVEITGTILVMTTVSCIILTIQRKNQLISLYFSIFCCI